MIASAQLNRYRQAAFVIRSERSTFFMAALLIALGIPLIGPIVIIIALSFNTAHEIFAGDFVWGLENWRLGFQDGRIPEAVANTFMVWGLEFLIAMPLSVVIAWTLARTRIPFSYPLEFLFWVAYITPGGVIAWILLLDPNTGYINLAARNLPFVDRYIFDIFSVPGIILTGVMGNGIALKVMLLTPAFRNMDSALEEAGRVGGASSLRTVLRITIPMMISPIALVTALQLMRVFQSFEAEFLLGTPIGFYVYSTLIFDLVRLNEPPLYGQATVLASVTLVMLGFIIPLQRWILQRRRYTTISSGFKPGLTDLGVFRWPAFGAITFLHAFLTVVPLGALVLGSFMVRSGYFQIDPVFTLAHWDFVLSAPVFTNAVRMTLILAFTAGIFSPLLFSLLGYILVRTRWRGRFLLDSIIWISAALPGMLTALGLLLIFLWTPGLSILYGSIWALILVVILQGNTTGVNISKASIVQVGFDLEEAGRISGANWITVYFKIWLPLLMPTLLLLGVLNFNIAASTTASIILLASRDTITLSILALEWAMPGVLSLREAASAVLIVTASITLATALVARRVGLRLGVRHS